MDLTKGHETVARQEEELWQRLVAGILRGDEAPEREFASSYGKGAAVLLRRRLGVVGTDQLVVEVMAGAVREIRRGMICEPRDLVHFLQNVAERETVAQAVDQTGVAVNNGITAQTRIRAQAVLIAQVLAKFPAAQRVALSAYYVDNRSAQESAAQGSLTLVEFAACRKRLRQEVDHLNSQRKPAAAETAAGLTGERAMAAAASR